MSIKVNEYFEGKVKSLGFESQGRVWTAGVIDPGEYEFSTSKEEHLTVSVGRLEFTLPGQEPQALTPGQTIVIPAGIAFLVKAPAGAAYVCEYV